ncbi:MAG: tRNA (cytosine(32)/uridine(32)-2'-O)-methyltransferase TrmJ [Gammaproteobacteria bacterium]
MVNTQPAITDDNFAPFAQQIRIVLVGTQHPGNIGMTARAMKTMGFKQLYLVSPQRFPDPKANELASRADDILEQAIIVDTLSAATAECHVIFGSSARPRYLSQTLYTPKACAELVAETCTQQRVALVFGREQSGLTNEELQHCHYHLNIPTNPEYCSLNLAMAVQVVCYELRCALLQPRAIVDTPDSPLAEQQEVERFYQHLEQALTEINFLRADSPRLNLPRLKRLFQRARLEQMEVNLLRGVLSAIQYRLKS